MTSELMILAACAAVFAIAVLSVTRSIRGASPISRSIQTLVAIDMGIGNDFSAVSYVGISHPQMTDQEKAEFRRQWEAIYSNPNWPDTLRLLDDFDPKLHTRWIQYPCHQPPNHGS